MVSDIKYSAFSIPVLNRKNTSNNYMKLDFDADWMRTSMSLWRDVTEMKVKVHDDFLAHLMSRKKQNLTNFVATASAWQTMLRSCKPTSEDAQAFQDLQGEVDGFIAWAKGGLEELEHMALQEVITDGLDQLLQDPDIRKNIGKLLSNMPKKDGEGGSTKK